MLKFAKNILPADFVSLLKNAYLYFKKKQIRHIFIRMYRHDMLRYLKYSRTFGSDNPDKMIGAIVLQYHVIEKGLTMPGSRLGFGKERIISLCQSCINYMEEYGQNDDQLNHAIGVVLEYKDYHERRHTVLDKDVEESISNLLKRVKRGVAKSIQRQTSRHEYFKYISSAFPEFSNSRASVRNYSEEDVPMEKIQLALEITRKTPSACNRQAWRTYIFIDKTKIGKILEAQGGNRGFGHLANKLIVITGELGVFCNSNERNQVYIDGGMYAMNLLYALHSNEIAACILNCSFDFDKEMEIIKSCSIKESEVLIAMIVCGTAPFEFKIAASPRYGLTKTNTIIK